MCRIKGLLLLVGACTAFASSTSSASTPRPTPPPYVESNKSLHKAGYLLQEHLLNMNVSALTTNYKRHYAVIVTVLGEFAEYLSNKCVIYYFPEYIKEVDKNVILGLSNPQHIIDKVKKYSDLVYNKTDMVRDLVRACKHLDPPQRCNQIVDSKVRNKPKKYATQAKLLLEVGKLADQFIEESDSFLTMAKTYSEVGELINGAYRFQSLVLRLDHIIRLLEPRPFCTVQSKKL